MYNNRANFKKFQEKIPKIISGKNNKISYFIKQERSGSRRFLFSEYTQKDRATFPSHSIRNIIC
jgi:hypothetical protein